MMRTAPASTPATHVTPSATAKSNNASLFANRTMGAVLNAAVLIAAMLSCLMLLVLPRLFKRDQA